MCHLVDDGRSAGTRVLIRRLGSRKLSFSVALVGAAMFLWWWQLPEAAGDCEGSAIVKAVVDIKNEADDLYREADWKAYWPEIDEGKMREAAELYEMAWETLTRSNYPDGNVVENCTEARKLKAHLETRIESARSKGEVGQ